jgi:hypothetical protein
LYALPATAAWKRLDEPFAWIGERRAPQATWPRLASRTREKSLKRSAAKFFALTQGNGPIYAVCMRTTKLRVAIAGVERVVIANRKDILPIVVENDAAPIADDIAPTSWSVPRWHRRIPLLFVYNERELERARCKVCRLALARSRSGNRRQS